MSSLAGNPLIREKLQRNKTYIYPQPLKVMYVTAKSAFLIYLIWAVIPQKFLDEHGLEDFFPSKYWALVFPVWIIIATIFIWLIYFGGF